MNVQDKQSKQVNIDIPKIYSALESINPTDLNYDGWLKVGMALKSAGETCDTWETWSARDPERFHNGECRRKWDGFNGNGVTAGSLLYLAKQNGWAPPQGSTLDWDGRPTNDGDTDAFATDMETPAEQLTTFLNAVFEAEDIVRIVPNAYVDHDGKTKLTRGNYEHTRDELLITAREGGVDALGPFTDVGAWVAVNPVDGNGVRATNIVRFKHTLIESDNLAVEEQERLIRKLNLPVTTLTHSGGKSIHALVRVDAADQREYKQRVERLQQECIKAGLEVDAQCKDPGRLTRLPGVLRNGVMQRLLDIHIGCESWEAWIKYIETPRVEFRPTKIAGSGPMPKPLFTNGPMPGGFGLVIGEDGVGKGWAILDLLLSCTLGRPMNLQTVSYQGGPLRVLYLCYEDLAPALEWRLDRISEAAGINSDLWHQAEDSGLLTIKALPQQFEGDNDVLPLFQQEMHQTPRETAFIKAMENYILDNKIQLCIIDPLAAAAVLQSENDNAAMNAVAVSLRAMAARTGCTTLVVHHTAKAAHGSQHHHAARGGSALPGAGRWQMQLSQEKHDAPISLSISKNSYGRRIFNMQLERKESGVLRELTRAEEVHRARELIYKVVDWIKANPDLIINHNAVANKSGDAKVLVETMIETMGVRAGDVFNAITTAANEGLLRITEVIRNHKMINIVTAPEETPALAQVGTPSSEGDYEEEIPFD